ncbi:hypothetical protein ABIA48_000752 [Pseudomonas sp. S30_BP2TU TE3576]|jgi:hypothetical protein
MPCDNPVAADGSDKLMQNRVGMKGSPIYSGV